MATKMEQEFNKNRRLHLLNLPQSPQTEVREFLTSSLDGIEVKGIHLYNDQSEAIVELSSGEKVDEAVSLVNEKVFKDNVVKAKSIISRHLLCISQLPVSNAKEVFEGICQKHGPCNSALLMETASGDSVGYSFVEFKCEALVAQNIKELINGKEMADSYPALQAEFLKDSAQQSFESARSKCLLVHGMPADTVTIGSLREIFSCNTSPIYCQMVFNVDKTVCFGIVEFKTADEAEATWNTMRDKEIKGKKVNITFCIPGKSALEINSQLVQNFEMEKEMKGGEHLNAKIVIEHTPLYQNLFDLDPQFAKAFTSVLAELQKVHLSTSFIPANKPGLLGPAPAFPMSPVSDPDLQLGLAVLLAILMRKHRREPFPGLLYKLNQVCEMETAPMMPKPSLLGDPMCGQATKVYAVLKAQLDAASSTNKGAPLLEPLVCDWNYLQKKFATNIKSINLNLLVKFGQLISEMPIEPPPPPPPKSLFGEGLLSTPLMGPGLIGPIGPGPIGPGPPSLRKGPSLLGPVPGRLNPLLGNNDSFKRGTSSLLGEPPYSPGKLPTPLLGPNMQGNKSKQLPNRQQEASNKAIVQAMGLGMGASGMDNLSQTLLGQISQGLVHQIGQNLMYHQMSYNDQDGGYDSKGGLLGDVPLSGNKNKKNRSGGVGGKGSLLGERPSYKNSQGSGGQDQGNWKAVGDNRWGHGGYESGYANKSMGMGGYNDFGDSYQDMGGYGGGYGGGFGDDYYNNYGYYGSAGGYDGSGGNSMGAGGGNYSMGGSGGGDSGNQASGVNFQDASGNFGKEGANSSGLGQDSNRFGGGMDGFGGGYGGSMTGSGSRNMGDGGYYDSFGGSSNMGKDFNDWGMGTGDSGFTGKNNDMYGMGMGNNMVGMGNNMGGMGNNVNSMGNNMNMGAGMGSKSNLSKGGVGGNKGGKGGNFVNDSGMGNLGSGGGGNSLLGPPGLMDNYDSMGSGSNQLSAPGAYPYRDQGNMGAGIGNTGSVGGLLPAPGGKFNQQNAPGQKRGYNSMLPKPDTDFDNPNYMSQMAPMGVGQFDSYKRRRF